MKIFYTRYTEMSCFTIRETIGPNEWKMLRLGFDQLFKELEDMLLINLIHAEVSGETLANMIAYKKEIPKLTKQKVYFIHKDKTLGDFPKVEIFLSRFPSSKIRHIGDKIILHDDIYALGQEIVTIEAQIQQLGFDNTSSKKEIQKNAMVKSQQKALDQCLKWQRMRKANSHKVPSDIEELEIKIKSSLDEIGTALGSKLDL